MSIDTEDLHLYYPKSEFSKQAHVKSLEQYQAMHDRSLKDPDGFWSEIADEFFWKQSPSKENVFNYNFDASKGDIFIEFMKDGITNMCYNALDRHIENGLGDKIAYFWEGNDPNDCTKYSYKYLYDEVCKFGNLLRSYGVKKGDRIAICMPMVIHLPISLLACARIGALHSVVFGGYSADSIADRILDGKCKMLLTCDGAWRGTKLIHLKDISDKALEICEERSHPVEKCIIVQHVTEPIAGRVTEEVGCRPTKKLKVTMKPNRDEWWHEAMSNASLIGPCPIEWNSSEDPLFLLYTSGSTGKPKGVMHTTAGYMIYTATTFKYTFDYHPDDVYWCTADIGWITGHSYAVYGPLLNNCTSVMFEGLPNYPDPSRCWQIVDKYKVTKFYTAPTAIRALMKSGNSFVLNTDRSSLKVLATVGEPINPRAWLWYHEVVGDSRCPVIDTFWQTETGGHVITPLPGATPLLPGSATLPFFGVEPALLNEEGHQIDEMVGEGYLVFKRPWPGIMRTVYGNHERFQNTYFRKFYGYYTTGDGSKRDSNGFYTVTGRIDDMLNVSGHLISTAQVESALVSHPEVVEAAVVGAPHEIKGECIYCFVTRANPDSNSPQQPPHMEHEVPPALKKELVNLIRTKIGPIAAPDYIQDAPGLPKTRSGKIMRRILRKIAWNDSDFGDISTLADPSVVNDLMNVHKKFCPTSSMDD